jgi:hypothetical protein
METVEPGRWYFSVICHGCSAPIPLMQDESQGQGPYSISVHRQKETIQCPQCGYTSEYPISEVQTGLSQHRP